MTNLSPRVAMLAITKHGAAQLAELAPLMPDVNVIVSEKFSHVMSELPNSVHIYSGALRAQMPALFNNYDQLVFFVSLGAVVRLIAPHLKSKEEDPGITVVDDVGNFVIPVLSGHLGGANAYAEQLAELLNATAVITTASDVGKTLPVDILGRELGWKVEAPKINITRVSAHVVNEEPIAFIQECGATHWWNHPTPLPKNIYLLNSFNEIDLDFHKAVLWVTQKEISDDIWQQFAERLVVYRPPLEVKK